MLLSLLNIGLVYGADCVINMNFTALKSGDVSANWDVEAGSTSTAWKYLNSTVAGNTTNVVLKYNQPNGTGHYARYIGLDYPNYAVQATLACMSYNANSSYAAQAFTGFMLNADAACQNGYEFVYSNATSSFKIIKLVTSGKTTTETVLGEKAAADTKIGSFQLGTIYTLKMITGSTLKFYVNGELVVSAAAPGTGITGGSVACITTYAQTEFDNIMAYTGVGAEDAINPGISLPYRSVPPISGLYYNYAEGTQGYGTNFADHDLLDGVWLAYSWKDVEPTRGVISQTFLDKMQSDAANWINASTAAGYPGRKALLSVRTQGLLTKDTPDWLYQDSGGPCAKMETYTSQDGRPPDTYDAPVIWDGNKASDAYLVELEPMIKAYAEKFDNDPNVGGIEVCIGHLGHLAATMNTDFAPIFKANGWNPDAWYDVADKVENLYLKYFKNKPLFITSHGNVLLEPNPPYGYTQDYQNLAEKIVNDAAWNKGIGMLLYDLRVDANQYYTKTSNVQIMQQNQELVDAGIISMGEGDDWPLYDPLKDTGPKSADDYANALSAAIGSPGLYSPLHPTFMTTFATELNGSYVAKKNVTLYSDTVRNAVLDFKTQLFRSPFVTYPDEPQNVESGLVADTNISYNGTDTITGTVQSANTSEFDGDIIMYLAKYDSDGTLVDVDMSLKTVPADSDYAPTTLTLSVLPDEVCTVELGVWEAYSNRPIAAAKTWPQ